MEWIITIERYVEKEDGTFVKTLGTKEVELVAADKVEARIFGRRYLSFDDPMVSERVIDARLK